MTMREKLVDRLRRIDSIAWRTILVLLLTIGAVHLVSLATYRHAFVRQSETSRDARLADQLLSIRRAVMREPEHNRETVAHELSGGPLEAHWSRSEHARPGGPGSEPLAGLADRLRHSTNDIGPDDLIIGANRKGEDDPHLALVSIRLPDQSWVNVSLVRLGAGADVGRGVWLSTSMMALGALTVAILVVRWLTRPLTVVAGAAKRFSGAGKPVSIPEDGPLEVRELAHAFNDMQRRIVQLVADRTQALAAVSHDLRTPITRLRLRAVAIPDPAARLAVEADLSDVERMIDQTLAYLRGDTDDEQIRTVDVVSILETIADDMADAGARVMLTGNRSAVIYGRRLALKRAFGNLIENAVKYGGEAAISVSAENGATVSIADRGPGIEPAQIERAFEPFVRLEPSRNPATGGFGLGLTIAKRIIEGHGGTLSLRPRAGGGLVTTIRLPRSGPSAD